MYENYIALDWAQANMAVAKMTCRDEKISVFEGPASIKDLQLYLKKQVGKTILTFEETTTAQWLFTELKKSVDEVIVCDPYRNKLLSEGPKTDKLDAKNLVRLLKANLLKPVFHTSDKFISYRKLVSGYNDLVKLGVRAKNQRSSLFRGVGLDYKEDEISGTVENFVLTRTNAFIELYEKSKKEYEGEFKEIHKESILVRNLESIPGIGLIGAVKIAAIVVNGHRFLTKNHFLSYCGLVKYDLISGNKSYGKRTPRFCRDLKAVFKIGALACLGSKNENPFKDYYNFLTQTKNYAPYNARHAVARRLAVVVYGVLKGGKKFDPTRLKIS